MNNTLSNILRKSILIRETEKTLLDLFSMGRLNGTIHTCIGQEYTGAILSSNLIKGDVVFSNHRCHGHYIGRTDDVEGLLLEVMGSSLGAVFGIGGSQHLFHADGFFSNGILGGMSPVAAGYSVSLLESNNIACLFIGDGAIGEGVFYESLNLISKFQLPIIIINENNYYSQSTSSKQTFFGDMKKRIEGFGIEYKNINIWDFENFIEETNLTFTKVRNNRKPIFLEVECYRLKAHSKGDDNRDSKEIEKFLKIDPINFYKKNHRNDYLKYKNEARKRIDSFLKNHSNVSNYTNTNSTLSNNQEKVVWTKVDSYSNKRVNDLIYESIKDNMESNKNIFFIGEDIEFPYGGAFKVSRDLSSHFEKRVFNMPDSEQAIIGFGNGLALAQNISICELMFGDFLGLAFDQWINHSAKFKKMYGNRFNVPIIIRTPMGGKRGYGPTHSQNIEKHFLGIPNTQIIVINPRHNPKEIYNRMLETIDKPTLVIENKLDYTRRDKPIRSISNYRYCMSNSLFYDLKYSIEDENSDITVVCWGGLVCELEEIINNLTENEEIIVEMIIPTIIFPINIEPIKESICKTKKILIVEDDSSFSSLGSEIISTLNCLNIDFRSIKLNTIDDLIPSSKILEEEYYVSKKEIYDSMKKLYLL